MISASKVKSSSEWLRWGVEDPLWAVVTDPDRQRDGRSPWTLEGVYATGDEEWQDFLPHWLDYGIDRRLCLEIGCGVGRMTRHLAATFAEVLAVDVSPEMLSHARIGVQNRNVTFIEGDGECFPCANAGVTAAFSTHVFQHLDSRAQIIRYFAETYRVLQSGGTVMIHVPLYAWPHTSRINKMMSALVDMFSVASLVRARVMRALGRPIMRMTAIHTENLFLELREIGFRDVQFRWLTSSRNGAVHTFVFARK